MNIKKDVSGDELLRGDLQLMLSRGERFLSKSANKNYAIKKKYFLYPNANAPRFIIPQKDKFAQRFILKMLSVERGFAGLLVRTLLCLPGGLLVLRTILFRNQITTGRYDR